MNNKEFARQFEKRTKKFAVAIIKLSSSLGESPEAKVIRYQLTKSGTSIGANYREANRARSKAEFSSRIKISESESSETVFWLEVSEEAGMVSKEEVQYILREANEILSILSAISRKL